MGLGFTARAQFLKVYAVLGGYVLIFPQGRVSVLQGKRVVKVFWALVIGLWIVLQFFSGIGSIANAAETGGWLIWRI